MKLCVYCASSAKVDKKFFDATEKTAEILVANNIEVVYGGGAVGLMGKLADTVLLHGGKIKGIIPHFMHEVEWTHKGVKDIEFTETMHERKAKFLVGIDGIITLAGGSGTFEELLEAITLKRLGKFAKPIIILNTDGYYNPLKELLENSVKEKFMNPQHLDLWKFVDTPEEILPAILNSPEWDENAIKFAGVR